MIFSRNETACLFFSHIANHCFLLSVCESTEPCEGCMYGPPLPPISDCQTTETPLTTMEETTMTSEGPETTTEGPEETTTMISCEDFTEGLCPLSEDNILNSTSSTPSVEECQLICR